MMQSTWCRVVLGILLEIRNRTGTELKKTKNKIRPKITKNRTVLIFLNLKN